MLLDLQEEEKRERGKDKILEVRMTKNFPQLRSNSGRFWN